MPDCTTAQRRLISPRLGNSTRSIYEQTTCGRGASLGGWPCTGCNLPMRKRISGASVRWCRCAARRTQRWCRCPTGTAVAYTLMNHWNGVLRWFGSQDTRGSLESLNSLLRSAKAKARDYCTHKNFINIAYLTLGKLISGYSHETSKNRRVHFSRCSIATSMSHCS